MIDYNPGGCQARELGCTCPVLDNGHGRGRGGCGEKFGWWVADTCPLHSDKVYHATYEEPNDNPNS